jgi:carbon storage regulator
MLVLNRKLNEQIVIGKDIVVTVTRLTDNRVSLAIEAPKAVAIVRGELRKEAA